MKNYDVIIIGAGTAGLSARKEVVKITDNYLVVDSGPLGTTCARVGCMPSKVLLQVANDYYRRYTFKKIGIHGEENLSINTKEVMSHVRKLRDRFVNAVNKDMESWLSTHLMRKQAKFISANELDLEGEIVSAQKIIIASGSSPIIPNAWLEYKDYLIDTNDFFDLEDLPPKMAVIGLGVIGLELGQGLHRLGVDVINIGNTRSIGGLTDPKVQGYVIEKLSEEMNISLDGAELTGRDKDKLIIKSGKKEYRVDKVLLAMGRRPNIDNLGLENLSIEWSDKKIPLFDEMTYQLKGHDNIYLVGDVNAERPILHEAADQGRIAGFNSVRSESQCFHKRTPLNITFSYPNIASVGKTFESLKNREILIGDISYEGQGRAIVMMQEKGLLHIYADKNTGRLLGAELFAPNGEHLAHLLSWAISLGLSARETLSLPFYHPVLEEGLRTALRKIVSQQEDKADMELFRCQDNPFDKA